MEINKPSLSENKSSYTRKRKVLSTKVDMTPMVDLGFLLITFFIFTATLNNPTALKLFMPADDKGLSPTNIKESGAMTVIIGSENSLFYYTGKLNPDNQNILKADFTSIRNLIINKKKEVMDKHVHDIDCDAINKKSKNYSECLDKDLVIVIKPGQKSNYKSVIDLLDEMTINDVKRFAIVEIEPEENKLLQL
jgi:biopolymer transport protein ExbD